MVCCAYAGVGAAALSFVAYGGWPSTIAFFVSSVAWMFTAAMGFHYIRNGDVVRHREYMIRNYAMTLSSVTIRLYLIAPITYNAFSSKGTVFDPTPIQYIICVYLSTIPNLIVAELFLRYSRRSHSSRVSATNK